MHSEFLENAMHMVLHRRWLDGQPGGDGLVGQPVGNELGDLRFASCQRPRESATCISSLTRPPQERVGQIRGARALPARSAPQDSHELQHGSLGREESRHAGASPVREIDVLVRRDQYNQMGFAIGQSNASSDHEIWAPGRVDQDDVGSCTAMTAGRRVGGACRAGELEIILRRNESRDALPVDADVRHNEDPDSMGTTQPMSPAAASPSQLRRPQRYASGLGTI